MNKVLGSAFAGITDFLSLGFGFRFGFGGLGFGFGTCDCGATGTVFVIDLTVGGAAGLPQPRISQDPVSSNAVPMDVVRIIVTQ